MDLCSMKHDEVCYESRDCPACELQETIEEQDGTRADLEEQIVKLDERVEELEVELEELKAETT